ncbi:MAG: extracellular solute-binding protein [Lachnospiraceae bacterium]|nr:extracellular solute-binding protein [Lachnospiraceae bacterium]
MKKKLIAVLLTCAMALSVIACGSTDEPAASSGTDSSASAATDTGRTDAAATDSASAATADDAQASAIPGFENGKFTETRHISVEVYDRGNDGGTDPTDNMYTDYIKKGMLDTYNVEVEFVAVPRWTEVDEINNLLAAGTAPDICLTYDYPTVLAYADMGGVLNMADYVDPYRDLLPHLWDWLGEDNIYYDKDPNTGVIWALEGKRANIRRINTFVRKDWLDALGMAAPTTEDEFYEMLIAFRDNADTLLGADADKMVPFSMSYDIGWRAANLIESYLDPNMTDKEFYVNGFDDRKLTENGTKEAIRTLNKWYNEGLIWKDFALYGSGDTTEEDMVKSGYVGSFIHGWDYPYQTGAQVDVTMKSIVGDQAEFIAIDCFKNSAGDYAKFSYSTAGDRKIFFPSTNDEPLASMLYLDWISDPEHVEYLQIGDEGQTHKVLDNGAIAVIAAQAPYIQNSGQNIDMTITCNGLNLSSEELTLKSMANNYAGIDPDVVMTAMQVCLNDSIIPKAVNVGTIEAEAGLGNALSGKRDILLDNAVVAPVDQFDAVWDAAMEDYMSSGGKQIRDEREEKWNATFGDQVMLP